MEEGRRRRRQDEEEEEEEERAVSKMTKRADKTISLLATKQDWRRRGEGEKGRFLQK